MDSFWVWLCVRAGSVFLPFWFFRRRRTRRCLWRGVLGSRVGRWCSRGPRGRPRGDIGSFLTVLERCNWLRGEVLAGSHEGGPSLFLFGRGGDVFVFGVELGLLVFELLLFLLFEFEDAVFEVFGGDFAVGDVCCSEIDEFEVSVAVKHHVFGLSPTTVTLISLCVRPLVWRYWSRLTICAM